MKYKMISSFSVEECEKRFCAAVGKYHSLLILDTTRPFLGRIDDHGFRLRVRPRNPKLHGMAPVFYGTFRRRMDAEGAIIEGHFSIQPIAKIILAFLMISPGLMTCVTTSIMGLAIVAVLLGFGNEANSDISITGLFLIFLGPPLIWLFSLLLGAGAVLLGKWQARSEEDSILRFLKDTLDAHIIQSERAG